MNIPKKLHMVWIGDESKTPWSNIESWKAKHPNWEFRLWGNKDLETYNWQRKDVMDEYLNAKIYPGAADVMRHQILLDEGGFVAPADCICLHNVEPLLEGNQVLAIYENETARPGLMSPIISSVPGHKLLATILNEMHLKYKPNGQLKRPVFVTGNYYVTEIVKLKKWEGLNIMPSYRLFPIHFTGVEYKGTDKVYAVHVWGDTSDRGKGIQTYKVKEAWL